jgi:hypothetical protein
VLDANAGAERAERFRDDPIPGLRPDPPLKGEGGVGAHQYPALIFSNSAIIFCLSSFGTGAWNSVFATNWSTSA